MPAFDQFGFYLLAAVAVGLVFGALLFRSLSGRHAHHNDVRWRRRVSEMQTEHELSMATLTKTLRHAQEKQGNLRQALDESDETIRLLSAEGSTTFEHDIADRNNRIAELKTTLSHARAMLADAQDHELTLQRQVGELQSELSKRDERVEELLTRNAELDSVEKPDDDQVQLHTNLQTELENIKTELSAREQQIAEMSGHLETYESQTSDYQDEVKKQESQIVALNTQLDDMRKVLPALDDTLREKQAAIADLETDLSQERRKTISLEQTIERIYSADDKPEGATRERARVISINDHMMTDDLVARRQSVENGSNTEQRIRALESELHEWKSKYEAANGGSTRASDNPVTIDSLRQDPDDSTAKKDDLQQIRGIGPALETALNKLGFFQFEQLADMGQRDIEQIGRHDNSLPGRIRRYKWVEQARKLQKARHSNHHRPRA